MTDAQTARDDWSILKLANYKGKFSIEYGFTKDVSFQMAFERGIDEQFFTLVDISPIAAVADRRVMRVFRLTEKGWQRRKELEASHVG